MPASYRCPRCGQQVTTDMRFCPGCRSDLAVYQQQYQQQREQQRYQQPQQPHYPQHAYGGRPAYPVSRDETNSAMFCHLASLLGYLIPFSQLIIVLIIWSNNKDRSEFVREHSTEALNYQLSYLLYAFISGMAIFFLVGFLMLLALTIFDIIVSITGAMKASNGERYRYPLTIRFVK
ncbi:MAG: DUF4870 domain-containing protein [Candidatus Viridilinea halotolerans]|uniref:DUF4870 domain-containing protein n=1 Tax=Candidatus Viridilinea halotolerans TaxID=2491704 RepID=A0A426U0T8_9CHLR|nr:MAG: DUF4870 domain-containing protein [Candidatus Viridilinea halotolerans]